jgi:hypothetical protein
MGAAAGAPEETELAKINARAETQRQELIQLGYQIIEVANSMASQPGIPEIIRDVSRSLRELGVSQSEIDRKITTR